MFGIHCNIGVVLFVSEKWEDTGGGIGCIIECELREQEELSPVVLLVITIDLEILLQSLVSTFRLTVTFWVVTRGKMQLHIQCFTKQSEEVQNELGASVRGNMSGDSMLRKDMENEQAGQIGGSNGVMSRDENTLLRKSVNDYEDGIKAGRCW
ncbi:hypothetical protein AN958_07866 [Leucoagaricus sp. SymC.cos]|nr:hypothetical protein AN958_07866 [Leucoagaricus sp. SymC.cos]